MEHAVFALTHDGIAHAARAGLPCSSGSGSGRSSMMRRGRRSRLRWSWGTRLATATRCADAQSCEQMAECVSAKFHFWKTLKQATVITCHLAGSSRAARRASSSMFSATSSLIRASF